MLEETVARTIHRIRKQRKMTLQDLADRTGLTKGYLSKIERSLNSPPFSTLNQIATALGTDVTVLLNEAKGRPRDIPITFTKKNRGEIAKTHSSTSGYEFRVLAEEKAGKNMIPYVIEASFEEEGLFQHEGEEFIYVLEGQHEFTYDGKTYLMEPGDSVYFDAGIQHTGKSVGDRRAKLLAIMYKYKRL